MSDDSTSARGTPARTITLFTAVCIVVANMVGTGVFTSLGFQVGPLPSGFAILMLWFTGGICAICGALAYGELAAALPRSGGEYHYLSVIYHPALGFLAGWISVTIGFAAPVAAVAMACASYLEGAFPAVGGPVLRTLVAVLLVIIITGLHIRGTRTGSRFQDGATLLKLGLILVMILAGLIGGHSQPIHFTPQAGDWSLIASSGFAVSLVWVMFSYSGWNASVYVAGEIRDPSRNIPLSNFIGAASVAVLYLLLNGMMLSVAPMAALQGKVQVATVAGSFLFGDMAGRLISGIICIGLVATISSMVFIGPRVSMTMGQDWEFFRPLARTSARGVPVTAMLVQGAISILLILVARYEQVNSYLTFALSLCACLVVLGVYVLRVRQPNLPRPVRTWGYPITPAIFLAVNCWMLWYLLTTQPKESFASLGTMAAGLLLWWVGRKQKTVPAPGAPDANAV